MDSLLPQLGGIWTDLSIIELSSTDQHCNIAQNGKGSTSQRQDPDFESTRREKKPRLVLNNPQLQCKKSAVHSKGGKPKIIRISISASTRYEKDFSDKNTLPEFKKFAQDFKDGTQKRLPESPKGVKINFQKNFEVIPKDLFPVLAADLDDMEEVLSPPSSVLSEQALENGNFNQFSHLNDIGSLYEMISPPSSPFHTVSPSPSSSSSQCSFSYSDIFGNDLFLRSSIEESELYLDNIKVSESNNSKQCSGTSSSSSKNHALGSENGISQFEKFPPTVQYFSHHETYSELSVDVMSDNVPVDILVRNSEIDVNTITEDQEECSSTSPRSSTNLTSSLGSPQHSVSLSSSPSSCESSSTPKSVDDIRNLLDHIQSSFMPSSIQSSADLQQHSIDGS